MRDDLKPTFIRAEVVSVKEVKSGFHSQVWDHSRVIVVHLDLVVFIRGFSHRDPDMVREEVVPFPDGPCVVDLVAELDGEPEVAPEGVSVDVAGLPGIGKGGMKYLAGR